MRRLLTLIAMIAATTWMAPVLSSPVSGVSKAQPTCNLPKSNAEALVILSNYYQGYWWDHTNLTIAVQSPPKATQEQIDAINSAIQSWSDVLLQCFDGLITLENVTGMQPSEQRAADIVVHFVPRAGGVVFGGYAICGAHGCPNILVRSDLPPALGADHRQPGASRQLPIQKTSRQATGGQLSTQLFSRRGGSHLDVDVRERPYEVEEGATMVVCPAQERRSGYEPRSHVG